jgi:Zn-dependent M28 family amino/carboxypeptidase
MNKSSILLTWVVLVMTLMACQPWSRSVSLDDALRNMTADSLAAHIKRLASDEFEGRAPGTRGERLTITYLAEEFKRLGLAPGNPDGTYFQRVPLVGSTVDPSVELVFRAGPSKRTLRFGDDFVAWTRRVTETSAIDAEMVFVGYGVTAPEFNWDDFKDVDVKGKVIVMLINDPPVPNPRDPTTLDEKTFGGKAMTYYGRWTYKFESAADRGAAGALIIHETEPAGYPWEVVRGSWSGEQFDLVTADKNMSRCAAEGWITWDQARALFQMAGKDLQTLKKAAVSRDFRPVPLGVRASLTLRKKLRTIDSTNVIARRDGSDPQHRTEYVVFMAHWDHLGIGPEVKGDRIYNGALDNASGTAALLEIAKAFSQLRPAPKRSLLFLAVTAEEKGLLGSAYYAQNPLYPLEKTLAVINMDGLNVYGRTRDITIIGLGNSTLDDLVKTVAAEQGRTVRPDPEPEKGFFYRSDHFSFAKRGVPALFTDSGIEYIGRPEGWGLAMRARYTAERYHKPQDEFDPSWDLSGAIEDLRLLSKVGYLVATGDRWPQWNPGTEFKAVRERMLGKGE